MGSRKLGIGATASDRGCAIIPAVVMQRDSGLTQAAVSRVNLATRSRVCSACRMPRAVSRKSVCPRKRGGSIPSTWPCRTSRTCVSALAALLISGHPFLKTQQAGVNLGLRTGQQGGARRLCHEADAMAVWRRAGFCREF
jgi:hypothetical protein